MSEEGGFIDVESDEVPELGGEATASSSGQNSNDTLYHSDKRAHHNLLERRRRDHIKDSFHGLRDCIPSLQGEKVSRAHILNKATEYIRQMQRGGSMRESEITDLKKKNEVLEEQVRAIEQNRAVGSEQKIEEVLETVARQVQHRQRQRDVDQERPTRTASGRAEKAVDLSGRDLSRSFSMATRTTPTTVGSGADPKKDTAATTTHSSTTSSALNLLHLAGNLKNAQALLSALQKNLPQNATLANVKSMASKVSVPARPASQPNAGSLPRGIVTATTVPKGSSLPPNLASALQQQKTSAGATTTTTTPVLVGGKTSQLANHLTSQLKPTTTTTTIPAAVSAVALSGASPPDSDTRSDEPMSSENIATQALETSTLLQQQGGGEVGGASGGIPSLTAELIAQCFLNLPNSISSASAASNASLPNNTNPGGDESVATVNDAAVSAANVLAALGGSLAEGLGTANHIVSSPSSSSSPPSHPHTSTSSPLPPNSVTLSLPPTTLLATPTTNVVTTTARSEDTQEVPPVAKKPRLEPQL